MQNFSMLAALSGGAVFGIIVGILALLTVVFFVIMVPVKSYFVALFSGCFISMFTLAGMKLRKIDTMKIVEPYITARKAGVKISPRQLQTILFAGGHADKIVEALAIAKSANAELTIEQAQAIDLSGLEIDKIVDSYINPIVVSYDDVFGVCSDEIELQIGFSLTLKANLNLIVGGFGIDSLKNKVSMQIISALASMTSKKANENPELLLKNIEKVAKDGAYSLVGAEITKIVFNRDIGVEKRSKAAELQKINSQMEADKLISVAQLKEHQLRAKTEEMKAKVLETEAEVPRALADAIKEGRFSVMDYYKLMNLQADTAMRRALVNKDEEPRR